MLINDILDFFFPRYCMLCGERLSTQENHVCLPCYMHLPRTMFHSLVHSPVEKLFWGLIKIEKATSFIYYKDNNKEILLQLKYKNNPDVGIYMASQYAKEIKDSGFFDDIDVIVPVPLHWMRRLKRGYNQSEYVAKGISSETRIPVCLKAVKRIINNKSQTRMLRNYRRDNVEGIFRLVHPELLADKHVLIIDDVTTTGSTICACAKEILKAPNARVSVLTISFAGQTPIPSSDGVAVPTTSVNEDSLSKL